MSGLNVGVIGIGNPHYALTVIGSLACFYPERPWRLRLWDDDAELAELYYQVSERVWGAGRTGAIVEVVGTIAETVRDAQRVIMMVDHPASPAYTWTEDALQTQESRVLSLIHPRKGWESLAPALPREEGERVSLLHKANRLASGDEDPAPWLWNFERSPIRQWLES
ncbi:MAG: hypothetical protein JST35_04055 [Armatimonadetes bacterium]|nr:hypothetical protein [Armatimonadota bacterium]